MALPGGSLPGGPLVCVALYNFNASSSSELSLKQGRIVEIINKKENGWWLGSCDGYSGVFPCTYVRELNSPTVVLDEAVAKAAIPGLYVSKGQRVLVVHRFDNGYLIVAPLSRIQTDIVHAALVQELPKSSPVVGLPLSNSTSSLSPASPGRPLAASMPVPATKPLPPPPGKAASALSSSGGMAPSSPHGHTRVLRKPLPSPTTAGAAPCSPVVKKALPKPPGGGGARRGLGEKQDSLEAAVLMEKRRIKELKKRDAAEKKERKKRKKEREKEKKAELERKREEREMHERNEQLRKEQEATIERDRLAMEQEMLILQREEAEREAAEQRAAEKARKEALALAQASPEKEIAALEEVDQIWKETEEKWKQKDEWDDLEKEQKKKSRSKKTLKRSARKKDAAALADDGSSSDEEVLLQASTGGFMDDLASLTTL